MKLNKNANTNILIVGLGLLGGSYAMALKKKGYHVEAITRSQSSIDYALEHKLIDAGSVKVEPEMVAKADLTVFALYPHVFMDWLKEYQQLFRPGAILTDVTGVKSSVVYEIQAMLRDDVEFIAAHPMAGKEVYGVENADDRIFEGANYIVVPTEKNTDAAIELCEELGWELGFRSVSRLSPEEHDEMIAYLSQLTHCIAVTLMCCHDNENLVAYTGDSFRDLTRIAKINDAMWSELFMMNKSALLAQMDLFIEKFQKMRNDLDAGNVDEMRKMMQLSTQRRKFFDK
ncbi:MAG: prephenate dehydrogenase [Clostridia bacterium]|nr:prephenate dehydrogenase [Clostridia bacterium]